MSGLKWDLFADTVINKLGKVKSGEVVLIVADTATNLDIAHAYLSAALRAGADASLIVSRYRLLKEVTVPKVLEAAFPSADIAFGLGRSPLAHSDAVRRARAERGTRLLTTNTDVGDYLYEGVLGIDYDRMLDNANRYADLLRQANHVHVVDDLGTDVEFDVGGRPVVSSPGMVDQPGVIDFYPGAQVSDAPIEESINGIIVADGSITSEGVLAQPVRITMEKGIITAIEGGAQAHSWKQWLDSTDDPKIYRLCHFSVGFNPKARITGNMSQDERLLGGIDFGFGSQDPKFQGTIGVGSYHTDIMLTSPSIYFDGTLITEKSRFNADLGFHQL